MGIDGIGETLNAARHLLHLTNMLFLSERCLILPQSDTLSHYRYFNSSSKLQRRHMFQQLHFYIMISFHYTCFLRKLIKNGFAYGLHSLTRDSLLFLGSNRQRSSPHRGDSPSLQRQHEARLSRNNARMRFIGLYVRQGP